MLAASRISVVLRHEPTRDNMQRLLTFDDLVAAGYVANRVTLSRRVRRGEFPAPIRVSSRNVAWLKSEVDAWEAGRIASRDEQSARAVPVRRSHFAQRNELATSPSAGQLP